MLIATGTMLIIISEFNRQSYSVNGLKAADTLLFYLDITYSPTD